MADKKIVTLVDKERDMEYTLRDAFKFWINPYLVKPYK